MALGITESIIRYGIRYPVYGVETKVRYRIGASTWSNIRKPYAEVFNVEGRTITRFNNYGLPGTDIENLDKPVVVLGSSYVEALQFQPEDVASSIFEDKIRLADPSLDVVNLGASGHDPYDSFFRLKYYDEKLDLESPDIMLIINSDNQDWFNRHPKPLRFKPSQDFGQEIQNSRVRLEIAIRNASALIELTVNGLIKQSSQEAAENDGTEAKSKVLGTQGSSISSEMIACIRAFKTEYPDFMVVSVYSDLSYNTALRDLCKKEGILFGAIPLTKPEYMINGGGHLNAKGNALLGNYLAQKFLSSSLFTNYKEE